MYGHVPYVGTNDKKIIWVAVFTAFLAFLTMAIDLGAYTFFSNYQTYGSWWEFLVTFLVAFGELRVNPTPKNMSIYIVPIGFAVIVSLIGASRDATGSIYFNRVLEACTSNTNEQWGNSAYFSNSTSCFSSSLKEYDCYCVDRNGECQYYSYARPRNGCSPIFSTYATNLSASAFVGFLTFIFIFILSILTCVAACCPSRTEGTVVGEYDATPTIVVGSATYVDSQVPASYDNNNSPFATVVATDDDGRHYNGATVATAVKIDKSHAYAAATAVK